MANEIPHRRRFLIPSRSLVPVHTLYTGTINRHFLDVVGEIEYRISNDQSADPMYKTRDQPLLSRSNTLASRTALAIAPRIAAFVRSFIHSCDSLVVPARGCLLLPSTIPRYIHHKYHNGRFCLFVCLFVISLDDLDNISLSLKITVAN